MGKLRVIFGAALLVTVLLGQSIAMGAPAESKKKSPRPTVLKLGESVPLLRCQTNPSACLCPKNARPIRYRDQKESYLFTCVNTVCPAGKQHRVKAKLKGGREGVCE